MNALLSEHGVTAQSVDAVQKAMRRLESQGKVNEIKATHALLVVSDAVRDPSTTVDQMGEQRGSDGMKVAAQQWHTHHNTHSK